MKKEAHWWCICVWPGGVALILTPTLQQFVSVNVVCCSESAVKDGLAEERQQQRQPQHPATPPTSPLSGTSPKPPLNGFKVNGLSKQHSQDLSQLQRLQQLSPALQVLSEGLSLPLPLPQSPHMPDTPDTCKDTLLMLPKKTGLQHFSKDGDSCYGQPPISPDNSRSCTPPASTSSGNSCRDDASSKDSRTTDSVCQWLQCGLSVDESDLLDHIRSKHLEPQLQAHRQDQKFVCLWTDCKVYNKKSSSQTWLEHHIVAHAGDKPFKCIVDGCGQRFTREQALQRHVNSHFNTTLQNPDNCRTVKHSHETPSKHSKKKKLRRKRSWLSKSPSVS